MIGAPSIGSTPSNESAGQPRLPQTRNSGRMAGRRRRRRRFRFRSDDTKSRSPIGRPAAVKRKSGGHARDSRCSISPDAQRSSSFKVEVVFAAFPASRRASCFARSRYWCASPPRPPAFDVGGTSRSSTTRSAFGESQGSRSAPCGRRCTQREEARSTRPGPIHGRVRSGNARSISPCMSA